jgi:hypothetical protein
MKAARIAAITALAFLALSALVGAVPMIKDPGGSPWWMPLSLLRYSPFHSFLIPGIILLFAIGLLSCWVLWLAITRSPGYGWWIAVQGCVLLGWLITEMFMLRLVMWAHVFYGAIALLLLISGLLLARRPGVLLRT